MTKNENIGIKSLENITGYPTLCLYHKNIGKIMNYLGTRKSYDIYDTLIRKIDSKPIKYVDNLNDVKSYISKLYTNPIDNIIDTYSMDIQAICLILLPNLSQKTYIFNIIKQFMIEYDLCVFIYSNNIDILHYFSKNNEINTKNNELNNENRNQLIIFNSLNYQKYKQTNKKQITKYFPNYSIINFTNKNVMTYK